ncbi:hypothetical protein K474DRAFT_1703402 [Panus rudis PR-1116 ss-1]|nr:hypothetical protein K474DRAFT_1703402 [Panus rudis PR-1116 ss-1]
MHSNTTELSDKSDNEPLPTQAEARPQLTRAQKAQITRAQNRQAQALEERRIANEDLGTRSSKARALDVVKDAIRSSRSKQQGKPTGRNKRAVTSDTDEEATPPPPTPPPKKKRISSAPIPSVSLSYPTKVSQYSGSQPAMRLRETSPVQGLHSDGDCLPAEEDSRRFQKRSRGRSTHTEGSSTEDEDLDIDGEEERRDMNDIDQGSDGEGAQSDGVQDLEPLASQPDALRAILDKETPRTLLSGDVDVAQGPSQDPQRGASGSQRRILPRARLTEDDESSASVQNDSRRGKEAYTSRGSGMNTKNRSPANHAARQHALNVNKEVVSNTQPGRRVQAIMAERPAMHRVQELHTRATAPTMTSSVNHSSNSSSVWPDETELVRGRRGKPGVTMQNPLVQSVAYTSIDALLADTIFRTEFVPVTQKFMREQAILVDITRQLEKESGDETFKLIRHRIKKDAQYTRDIIAIGEERVYQKRAEWKKIAKNYIRSEYGLQDRDENHFHSLVNQMEYLFPAHNGNVQWLQPFMRPIVWQVLHEAFFKGTSAFARKFATKFPTFNTQRQVPIGMLCCVAVAIYMAMHDVAYDQDKLSIQVKAAAWDAEYADMWKLIKGIEAGNPHAFTDLLVRLYELASKGQHFRAHSGRVDGVLAKIDFAQLGRDS